mgnify:CR=1 FL=1
MSQPVPVWARLAGELAVIIAGVLIALSADSWIDVRQDLRTEAEHLAALVEEFDESLAALDVARDYKLKQMADLQRLLSSRVRDVDPDSLDAWIYDGVYVTRSYVPVLSALRDLEASGELDVIGDPEIRRGLALLATRLEMVSTGYNEFLVYHQAVVDPFIATELPALHLLGERNGLPAVADASPDWSVLESDRARGILVFKLSLIGNYLRSLDALDVQFEAMRGLMSERLRALGA